MLQPPAAFTPANLRSVGLLLLILSFNAAALLRADDVTQTTGGKFMVRVLDRAQKPQAGAVVQLFGMDDDWRYWKQLGKQERCDSHGQSTFGGLATSHAYLLRAGSATKLVGYKQ